MLIVVLNSHDLWEDDPIDSAGINVGKDVFLVAHKPFSALIEGFNRYFIPIVRKYLKIATINNKVDVAYAGPPREKEALYNLKQLDILKGWFPNMVIVLHRTRDESKNFDRISEGELRFRNWASTNRVPIATLNLDPELDYRDAIHMNNKGHKKLYLLLKDILTAHS